MVTSTPAKKKTAAPAKKAAPAPTTAVAKKVPATPTTQPATVTAKKTVVPKSEKKKSKPEKVKVVRDSFTIPKTEFAQIATMKKRAMDLGFEVKKSELIRAGLALLASTTDSAFRKAMGNVPTLKTGRPGKA